MNYHRSVRKYERKYVCILNASTHVYQKRKYVCIKTQLNMYFERKYVCVVVTQVLAY